MQLHRIVQPAVWLAYPLLIFFGLRVTQPRYVAGLLLLMLAIRMRRKAGTLLSGLAHVELGILAALIALALLTALTNSELLLRLYPAMVNLGMLALFGRTLVAPPSMIERFARLDSPDLSPNGVRYTLHVTQVWCLFFVINGGISLYTAFFASREAWSLYNGLIAYVWMGALFAGEWLARRIILRNEAR